MRPIILIAGLGLVAGAPAANAQHHDHTPAAQQAAKPVNSMCPIGKEPIVPSAGTVEYRGRSIGLCCPGCGKQFLAWDEARKDEFLAMAAEGREPGSKEHAKPAPAPAAASDGPTYPYTLPGCPVGGPLGSMGDPIVKAYDNREVRFCCASCIAKFEADRPGYWSKVDAQIVAQQLPHYPIDTCIVTGKQLGPDAVNHVHNNRLVRLADAAALKAFGAAPARHLAALDAAIIEAQLPGYPTQQCPVGGPLGAMGEPVNFIIMNRLVRLCCGGCEKSMLDDPATYTAKLDAAYADQQREAYPLTTCVVSGADLGSMGEPVELVAGNTLVRLCCAGCVPQFQANPGAYLSKLR